MSKQALTPFQPTGPYPQVMLDLPTGAAIPLDSAARGRHIVIDGRLLDGSGKPVFDAMIETWQADADGRYHHPRDPRSADADPAFWGYRRVATDDQGRFRIETVKPGAVGGGPPEGGHHDAGHHDAGRREDKHAEQAPHILLAIYGGGILYRYVTRLYFEDEPANASDPALLLVPLHRRHTLIAKSDAGNRYRFDIHLQGEQETVFFSV